MSTLYSSVTSTTYYSHLYGVSADAFISDDVLSVFSALATRGNVRAKGPTNCPKCNRKLIEGLTQRYHLDRQLGAILINIPAYKCPACGLKRDAYQEKVADYKPARYAVREDTKQKVIFKVIVDNNFVTYRMLTSYDQSLSDTYPSGVQYYLEGELV